ncbi:MAG: nitrite reductase, copper-containing [Candidatus Omnitrophica bacterium CG11_big_fil_rev_8_21_14_0_20_45_26]|uniref:Copper-containing nitrite reductase n=1 Tax=Candidatus Abzuiibacterium crystallinum TaxID=1974748 RepID=A0A2H0LPM7_9BACT|nr:MAG: nitrite reductase, copper-containing [Candidatus Omnitrophica bacterium CG11_big_fil_rev_8_21_14_0_20_45_26]PIW63589.1 MAG: nitrite reductase, copper-containing [Candidatus Omnitrophica bacterium CG12_big_fil_rev_8_21_14_0_65_45_16]
MKQQQQILIGIVTFFLGFGSTAFAASEPVSRELPVIEANMTFAPHVPPPIERNYPARVIIRLDSVEYRDELTSGIQYDFWGYNGQVPGPFIRVREGDVVQFHLKNHKDSKNTHTVDFHSITGPCGAACVLMTEPGDESVVEAKVIGAGIFVYHCAAPPIPVHIANGLYGLILVEPAGGMPKVDREYYVMQSEFYTETPVDGFAPFSSQRGMNEDPTFVVFNGKVGALTEKNALQAKTGETVRLYVGNIGPNLVSSFHVIGEIFDRVYREGTVQDAVHNVQTTLIPAGAASMVEFRVDVPGDFTLVDHSIFRINKGAAGTLHVEGEDRPDLLHKMQ